MNTKSYTAKMGQGVGGIVQCLVVDAKTKQVVRALPKQKNLILNQGLNYWAGRSIQGWQGMFTYACAGTGTTPTQTDSGLTTADCVGTTVTLAGGAFVFTNTATDSGKVIKWDTGQEAFILTVTDPTTVVVRETQTIPAGEFTVYLTNQTKMNGGIGAGNSTTDFKRTNTYVPGVGNCGSTWVSPYVREMKRTFDFSPEGVGGKTYTEIGFATSITVNAPNLCVRVLLAVPVSLLEGQQLRVVYTLTVSCTPTSPQYVDANITGWPVAPATDKMAYYGYEYLHLNEIDTNGGAYVGGNYFIEPGIVERCDISSNSTAITLTHVANDVKPLILSSYIGYVAYVADSFECYSINTITPAQANVTNIRSFFLGFYVGGFGYNPEYSFFRIVFDQNQTKDSLHKITVRFHWVGSRTLS